MEQAQVTAPEVQTPSQPAGSSANLDQPIDVVASLEPSPPEVADILAVATLPTVAANEPPPGPPQSAAVSSVFGPPHRAYTVSIKPGLTVVSKGEPEIAPLPPTKPKKLASMDRSVRAVDVTSSVSHLQRRSGRNDAHQGVQH
jgi:hypothetical protein